ncbi:DUF1640 domain-containing protein [Desulfovibrio sp. ZJ369]|uniref:DUF1640 domain-containing protein n=1 Tax=Desulfovibrio sp. ZJ369 TaxID=2709793 RepID=UPI0013EAA2E3|nr:DUF1640 domain-containing protein [Desulfovibrio sp. ZJ369]
MTAATFDTLGYFEKLKAAGFTEEQAKVQVEAMQGVVRSYDEASRKELATKGDLQDVRTELKEEIANTKHEILKWMMATMVAQTALLVAVIAFLK